ncbi:mitochondrial thiamine pyrophosphate carrier [Trichuris trichiura]|uniref:Mitochondrial thiamine pyrophosphate carrier n=1 Tax=Trichuris trichiura TaxID=36087 RepID=A0A077ZI60_TRITR|nr:mitochondrial thiamine pyrophosphate carrier [Trichuris trichiura]
MVGFNPSTKRNERLSALDHSIAGCASGVFARALSQPFDVLKIRFQLQLEPIRRASEKSKYRGVWQAFSTIVKEEGVSSLWKGHVPAQGLSILFTLVQFVSYEFLTEQSYRRIPSVIGQERYDQLPINFLCGATAGTLATVASLPLDVVRTRLVAQGEPKFYKHTRHAAYSILRSDGFRGLYRGFVPTVLQVAPYTGFVFLFYDFALNLWNDVLPSSLKNRSSALICPLDLLKKRLQVIGFEQARSSFGKTGRYSGFLHCIVRIIAEEGFSSFYKGFAPTMLKAAVVSSSGFLCYEQACYFLKVFHQSMGK